MTRDDVGLGLRRLPQKKMKCMSLRDPSRQNISLLFCLSFLELLNSLELPNFLNFLISRNFPSFLISLDLVHHILSYCLLSIDYVRDRGYVGDGDTQYVLGVSGAAREGTVEGPDGNVDAGLALADGFLVLVGGVTALALQTVLLAVIVRVHDIDATEGAVSGTKGEPRKRVTESAKVICGRIGNSGIRVATDGRHVAVSWLGRLISSALCCLMWKESINSLLTSTPFF